MCAKVRIEVGKIRYLFIYLRCVSLYQNLKLLIYEVFLLLLNQTQSNMRMYDISHVLRSDSDLETS